MSAMIDPLAAPIRLQSCYTIRATAKLSIQHGITNFAGLLQADGLFGLKPAARSQTRALTDHAGAALGHTRR